MNSLSAHLPHNNCPDLIHRDESLIVVNKPAGLLAVPGRGTDKQHGSVKVAPLIPKPEFLAICHGRSCGVCGYVRTDAPLFLDSTHATG